MRYTMQYATQRMNTHANTCKYMQIYENICKYMQICANICKYVCIFTRCAVSAASVAVIDRIDGWVAQTAIIVLAYRY